MNHSQSPQYSSSPMSELDSFSDSDWLDIASSRDLSDDNDSVSSHDSDRDDIASPPHSRRSSISLGSSREGDVDAWEGFVDDSGDEAAAADPQTGMYPIPVPLSPTADRAESVSSIIPAGFIPDIEQPEEDERVREALDQSLVSTLSASRASTGGHSSAHTSIRDLRLSFPDPLTSSRDELNRSYEDVSPSETMFSTTDVEPETSTAVPTSALEQQPATTPEQDPGLPSTTPEVPLRELTPKAGLDIVLYGSSSPIKWSFVQDFVKKAASVSGHTLVNTLEFPNGPVQILRLEKGVDSSTLTECIFVHDRTTDTVSELNSDFQGSDRPSLAIIYLPSARLPILSLQHSAYLPVVVPTTIHFAGVDFDAENDWDMLSTAVPSSKTLRLNDSSIYSVFDGEDLQHTDPLRVYHALQGVIDDAKKPLTRSIAEQLHSRQAVTLFALMSLIVGFAINTAFRPSTPVPTPTIRSTETSSLWGLFGPEVNRSAVITATTASGNTALISSSLKDLALSVFNPGTTSLSVTSQIPSFSSVAGSSKSAECKDCTSLTFSDRPRKSQDITVHTVSTTPSPEVYTKVSIHAAPSTGKMDPRADPTSTALSLKAISSLSQVVDQTFKAVIAVVSKDLQELMDAVDALMRAIQTQTHSAVKSSKGKARALGEHMQAVTEIIQYRNDRARDRARKLKKKGEEIIQSASEKIMGRTQIAKARAKHLKQSFSGFKSEAWRAYQQAHGEWVAKLKDKGHGYASLHERQCRRRQLQARMRRGNRGWKSEACDGFTDRL